MKYRVIGANTNTGARQVQEFEAESKAAAERKAMQSGMSVSSVQDITDGSAIRIVETRSARRSVMGMHPVLKLVIFLAVIGVGIYLAWPYLRRFM